MKLSKEEKAAQDKELTEKLKQGLWRCRTGQEMTLVETEKILPMPWQQYYEYESGKVSPSVRVAMKMADAFDVTLDYLCGRSEVKMSPKDAEIILKEYENEAGDVKISELLEIRQMLVNNGVKVSDIKKLLELKSAFKIKFE